MLAVSVIEAVNAVMKSAGARLLEPVMKLEITSEHGMAGKIGQDIIRKRGFLLSTDERGGLEVRLMETSKTYIVHLSNCSSIDRFKLRRLLWPSFEATRPTSDR